MTIVEKIKILFGAPIPTGISDLITIDGTELKAGEWIVSEDLSEGDVAFIEREQVYTDY